MGLGFITLGCQPPMMSLELGYRYRFPQVLLPISSWIHSLKVECVVLGLDPYSSCSLQFDPWRFCPTGRFRFWSIVSLIPLNKRWVSVGLPLVIFCIGITFGSGLDIYPLSLISLNRFYFTIYHCQLGVQTNTRREPRLRWAALILRNLFLFFTNICKPT